ncbi:hypothetical protein KAU11_12605 [Candidatus Babeliales bacterium]|nr:hypothetical protein [Candidatus Babeliales bacterium]
MSNSDMFNALMDSITKEDVLSDQDKKLAKDLLSKSPILDVILDPSSSYQDFVKAKKEFEDDLEAKDVSLTELNENMSPSQFLKVGRHLIEVQLGWENKKKRIARSTVFEDGRKIGKYYFAGKQYRVDETNTFDTVEEAIAHLIKTNGRKQYAQSQDNYVGGINNF